MQLIGLFDMLPKELIFIVVQCIGIFVLMSFRKQAQPLKSEQLSFAKAQGATETLLEQHQTEPGRRSGTSTGLEEVCTAADYSEEAFACLVDQQILLDIQTNITAADYSEEDCSSDRSRSCIRISGGCAQVKAARRALSRRGFLKKSNDGRFPLNGHWETMHGMSVTVEGKLVRWSPKRASRLTFYGVRRDKCSLSVYGEIATGRLVTPATLDGHKIVKWSNGDEWYSTGECMLAGQRSFPRP